MKVEKWTVASLTPRATENTKGAGGAEAAQAIALVKGQVKDELLLRNEYLAAQNEILVAPHEIGRWSSPGDHPRRPEELAAEFITPPMSQPGG